MAHKWESGFHATDIAVLINDSFNQDAITLREFLYPGAPSGLVVAARSVGKRLAAHVDEPVKSGEHTLILRKVEETTDRKAKGALKYCVRMDFGSEDVGQSRATTANMGGRPENGLGSLGVCGVCLSPLPVQ